HGARHPVVAFGGRTIPAAPDFLSVRKRETAQHVAFAFLVVVHDIDATVPNSRAGVPFAELQRPEQRRPLAAPVLSQRRTGGTDVRKICPTEPGPRRSGSTRPPIELLECSTNIDGLLGCLSDACGVG